MRRREFIAVVGAAAAWPFLNVPAALLSTADEAIE
jgi:hypothetical protein